MHVLFSGWMERDRRVDGINQQDLAQPAGASSDCWARLHGFWNCASTVALIAGMPFPVCV
jgi:hypothetical protein